MRESSEQVPARRGIVRITLYCLLGIGKIVIDLFQVLFIKAALCGGIGRDFRK